MTIFGPDISSYEAGLDLAALTDASFFLAKTTEGTYYTDAYYQGWRAQAGRLGKLFVWYHFLSGQDAAAQVAHTAACVGDKSLPGMLDVEPEGSFRPTLAQLLAYADAAAAAGLNLRLVYLPHWYWLQLGSPDLSGFKARGLALVSSAYPGGSGTAAQLYPGDNAPGWSPYGGITPALYQFTNQASDGGQREDFNAFRGTLSDLETLLTPGVDMTPEEHDMLVAIKRSAVDWADWQFYDPPGREQQVGTHAWRMQSSLNNTAALMGKMDQVLAHLGAAPPPAVDVDALAAALGPMLHPTLNAADVVAQLLPHLPGTPDPATFAAALAPHLVAKMEAQ